MNKSFREPIFKSGNIELRFEKNVICIYGTKEGLIELANIIGTLVSNPGAGHIHLEDCLILTKDSEKGAVAIFE